MKISEKFFPDIDDYLESIDHGKSVHVKELDWLINAISSKTNLNSEQSEIVLRLFFQEIRNAIIRGDRIILRKFGKIFLQSPKTTGSVERVFVKFEPSKYIVDKLNDR